MAMRMQAYLNVGDELGALAELPAEVAQALANKRQVGGRTPSNACAIFIQLSSSSTQVHLQLSSSLAQPRP